MQEFRDGSFGAIEPAVDLAKRLAETIPPNLKSVHFGSVQELERLRKRLDKATVPKKRRRLTSKLAQLQLQVTRLEARLNEATTTQHTHGVRVYPATALAAIAALTSTNSKKEEPHNVRP